MSKLFLVDRPIAFQRPFVDLTKSITASLMLSQAVYWNERTSDPDGWFYKTTGDWTDETGLSFYEQEGAVKVLKALGFLETCKRGMPAKTHYRVNEDALLEALTVLAKSQDKTWQKAKTGVGKKPEQDLAKSQDTYKEQRLHTETTEDIESAGAEKVEDDIAKARAEKVALIQRNALTAGEFFDKHIHPAYPPPRAWKGPARIRFVEAVTGPEQVDPYLILEKVKAYAEVVILNRQDKVMAMSNWFLKRGWTEDWDPKPDIGSYPKAKPKFTDPATLKEAVL